MDMVQITCYGTTETMTRQQGIAKYGEAMLWCEGSERERYAQILGELLAGYTECSDGVL